MLRRSIGWRDRLNRSSRRRARRLAFQALEPRAMLAGDVSAWVSGGTLFIRGDGLGNGVNISTEFDPETEEDVFVVTGFDQAEDATTINDEDFDEFRGVKRLDINLKGGDDSLTLTNDEEALFGCLDELFLGEEAALSANVNGDGIHVDGSVIINMGDGVDEVGIGGVHIAGNLIVNTGRDDDRVGLCEVGVDDLIKVATGSGESQAGFAFVEAGVLTVTGGTSRDDVLMDSIHADGSVIINTLGGEDFVGGCDVEALNLIINTGSGNDEVLLGQLFLENDLIITTGSGDDGVFIDEFLCEEIIAPVPEGEHNSDLAHDVGDDVVINTGSGDDDVAIAPELQAEVSSLIDGNEVGLFAVGDNVVILLGSGEDDLFVFNLHLDGSLTVTGGGGIDVASLELVDVGENATFNMGTGDDRLTLLEVFLTNDLFVFMGAGNEDFLGIDGSSGRKALLRGGSGDDDTLEFGSNDFESEDIKQFENEVT